jgi:aspartate 4-decarboxylase
MEEIFTEPCETYYKIFTDKETGAYKYRFLSPFEFKDVLTKYAKKSVGKSNILNAGRGNPNFFSTIPRYAYSLLTYISTVLGEHHYNEKGIGVIPPKKNIAADFYQLLKEVKSLEEAKFLKEAIHRMKLITKMNDDDLIYSLVTCCLGCFYPDPPRIQNFAEPILAEFLDKTVYKSKRPLKGTVDIFATEGATAAIVYIFNSLKYNGLVVPKDTIGIITPIFSPYLEIPSLRNYNLSQICIQSNGNNNWELSDEEINKIADPQLRALFLVNPSNPSSLSLSAKTVRKIAYVVRKSNPNLIIIADNVYSPFVNEFNSLFDALPRNTISVYSFSKYFGCTGWRLGTIMMKKSNIINKLLKKAPMEIHNRYKMISVKPQNIKFIDRIMMDSRQVAEAHTSGLSTPQQVMMSLFAIHDLVDTGRRYNDKIKKILKVRLDNLLSPLKYELPESPLNANYYIVIDILNVAYRLTGIQDFPQYLSIHRDPLEFLIRLAKQYGTILLPAVGFAGSFWGVRASLANLDEESYHHIGENIKNLVNDYHKEFLRWQNKK